MNENVVSGRLFFNIFSISVLFPLLISILRNFSWMTAACSSSACSYNCSSLINAIGTSRPIYKNTSIKETNRIVPILTRRSSVDNLCNRCSLGWFHK